MWISFWHWLHFFPQPPRPTFLAHLEFLKVCWIVHLVSNTNLNVPVMGGKKWCFCLPQSGRCVNSGCKELNKGSNNHAPTRLARSRVSVLATRPTANSRQSTSVMIPVLVVIVSSPSEPFSTFSTCSQTKLKPVNTMFQSLQSNQAQTCQHNDPVTAVKPSWNLSTVFQLSTVKPSWNRSTMFQSL